MALTIVAVVIGLVIIGQLVADRRADTTSAGMSQPDRDAVIRVARDFWDNPFQRLAFRAFGVTPAPTAEEDVCFGSAEGPAYEVTAYTLFGIELDRITCRNLVMSAPP